MRYPSPLQRNYQNKNYQASRESTSSQGKYPLFADLEESDDYSPTTQTRSEPQKPAAPTYLLDDLSAGGPELDAAETFSPASFDPHVVWQTLLSDLALQMPPASYNTWVRDTWVVGYEDGEFLIGIPNAYARDWLENRLRNKIKRALSTIVQRSVQVNFRVCPRPVADLPNAKPTPLYDAPLDEPVAPQEKINSQEKTNTPEKALKEKTPAVTVYGGNGGGHLNAQHTFETFVVGNHNKLAHAAAEAVAEKPGQSFNPLFIYGGVGLGKTHLLHAIGNRAQQLGYQILYCSSEQFTNELIGAIRNQSTEQFRNKYREVDILLIDDIQFIGGKESTQEEFFHTFNHLHAVGRQVVLSSDRPPKALATLEERLRSRFEGGLQTDISQPDYETRVAILLSKATRMGVRLDPGVLAMVAERVDSNVRELEGALNRLIMQARLANTSLTVGVAASILNNLAPTRTPCTPGAVVRIVAEHFRLTPDDLTGRKRTKEIANARQIAMYLLREENGLSLPAIGEQLGGRDHSTVRYGVEQVMNDLERDEDLRRAIVLLRDKIYTPFIG